MDCELNVVTVFYFFQTMDSLTEVEAAVLPDGIELAEETHSPGLSFEEGRKGATSLTGSTAGVPVLQITITHAGNSHNISKGSYKEV